MKKQEQKFHKNFIFYVQKKIFKNILKIFRLRGVDDTAGSVAYREIEAILEIFGNKRSRCVKILKKQGSKIS